MTKIVTEVSHRVPIGGMSGEGPMWISGALNTFAGGKRPTSAPDAGEKTRSRKVAASVRIHFSVVQRRAVWRNHVASSRVS